MNDELFADGFTDKEYSNFIKWSMNHVRIGLPVVEMNVSLKGRVQQRKNNQPIYIRIGEHFE